ncbi:MAG: radical SAM protein [Verrucomicrobia bacterium]|jgi:MoaA/NifB/PqqE/SkfB family radical SAM enzyme|nr:radical SAM protein [Verrucomicrobiota bacterium]MBT7069183.1 radical SAM protein [Verrucomicrobiota bacterium]MBT7699617.1 radical SAM protein [Verrucomicrobiota bacterium]
MGNVYSSSKIFHFPDRLQKIAAKEIPPPIHIRLKPTNRCNHNCAYCCYRNPDLQLGEHMQERDQIPPAKMREIVADLVDMGVRAVTFSGGGEPLCYPHIVETANALMDGGIKVAMLTNGARLDGEAAELLAQRATWVRVSIGAVDPESYARVRSVGLGEFDRVCNNMRAFAAMPGRTCVLGVNFIVTQENSAQVLHFLEMAREIGVDHVKVSGVVTSTEPEENRRYMAAFYDEVKAQIREAETTLANEHFSVIDKVHFPDSMRENYVREYTWCPMTRCLTIIAADQNVYTCQDKAYTTDGLLGSIRERSFADLWSSTELRERLQNLDPSRECRHHCVSHGKNLALIDFFEADQEHMDFV